MKHLPWHSHCTHGVVVPRPALKYQNKLHAASGHKLHTGPSNHHPSIQKQQSSIITEGAIEVCKKQQNRTNNNRKPKTENRKPQAKSETRRTRLRPSRRKFSEEEPEKHQTASNGKSENPILFFAENRKLRAKYTRNRPLQVTKTEKRKYFGTQTENGQNRKSQCPHLLASSESFKAETLHFITNSHEKKRY